MLSLSLKKLAYRLMNKIPKGIYNRMNSNNYKGRGIIHLTKT